MNDELLHGLVKGVHSELAGAALTAPAGPGDTVLEVDDAGDFNPKGGFLRIGGVAVDIPYPYDSADLEADTVTLAAGLITPGGADWPVDTQVLVWDGANDTPVVSYKASVDSIDGWSARPVDVDVDQSIAHVLSTTMRTGGVGESVTLKRDGAGLRIVGVQGRQFALAALQYIQEGLTTRQNEDEAGVDLLGADTGTPGLFAFGAGGLPSVIIDALTGDASFIGEIGTALPGELGIFLYSLLFQKLGDKVVTRPVMQFNIGASRDQPSIQSDNVGAPSLFLFSGAGTTGRETRVDVEAGVFNVGIEAVADDETYAGATLDLQRDGFNVFTDELVGPASSHQGVDLLQNHLTHHGYLNPTNGALRGFGYLGDTATDFARVYTATKADFVDTDASVFKGINASAFTVNSDRRRKANVSRVAGALEQLAALKVCDYDADDTDLGRARGVMAQDVQKAIPHAAAVQQLGKDGETETLGVDLYALLATTIAGLQELTAEVAELRAQVATRDTSA